MARGNREEAARWLGQAECDLAAAQVSMQGARYEWACFQAQQAAEKPIKSLLYRAGYRKILTRSVYELLLESQKRADFMPCLEQEAKLLESPPGIPTGSPVR